MSVETDAVELAGRYFANQGYTVEDVSRKRGHNGYDLIISKDGETTRIEVKGCSREWQIPDFYFTEFDQNRRLVADYLCVVYFLDGRDPFLCIVPRDSIPPEHVTSKQRYRISSRLKKKDVLEQFLRPLNLGG